MDKKDLLEVRKLFSKSKSRIPAKENRPKSIRQFPTPCRTDRP